MADVLLRASATRWGADEFPGWIELALVDADGQHHRIIEKVPVLTTVALTSASPFPRELWIRADAGDPARGRVRTELAHSVETTEGLTCLDASVDDVVWL